MKLKNDTNYSLKDLNNYICQPAILNKFKIITWNVRSIRSLNSFQKFKTEMAGFVSKNIDVIILTETWTDEMNKFDIYRIKNYNQIACTRQNARGGGVSIYVHTKHTTELITKENLNDIEYVTIRMNLNEIKITINAIYRPPHASIIPFMSKLEQLIDINDPVIIAGDLNINQLKKDNICCQMLDMLKIFDAEITNNAITRNASNTIIDYVIVRNLPQNLFPSTFTSSELNSSDHNLLLTVLNVKVPDKKEIKIISKKCNYDEMREKLKIDHSTLENLSAENGCEYLIQEIKTATEGSTITKHLKLYRKSTDPPWCDSMYQRLSNHANNILKKIRKLDSEKRPTNILRSKLNEVKITIDEHMNITSKRFYKNAINKNKNNSWNLMNEILGRKKSTEGIRLRINDAIIDDEQEIANLFNEKFSSISYNVQNVSTQLNYDGPIVNECIYLDVVTENEILHLINDLDSAKATGSDGISVTVIKEMKNILVKPLTYIINKMFHEGVYPKSLKYAHIKALHKKSDKTEIVNYRPIALLPIINKIIERILLNRFQDFLALHDINDMEQYGYKKKIGSSDAILKFTSDVTNYLDGGEYVIAIFIDLTSAFDTLNREVLLKKLTYVGIKGHVGTLLKSYFETRMQSVKVGNAISNKIEMNAGVPQGSILGPFLFNANQLDAPQITSKRIKFADDIVVYRNCKKEDIQTIINEMANEIIVMKEHFSRSGLILNSSKTKFMIFSKSQYIQLPNVLAMPNDVTINRVENLKFLGIELDENWNFKSQFSSLVNKLIQSSRVMSIIKHHLCREMLLDFYHAHFMSHLNYCSFLFSKLTKDELNSLQTLQSRCIKQIYGLHPQHPTIDLFKSYQHNSLPVIGIIYLSLISNIHKSILLNMDELIKFEVNDSNRRSNGEIKPCRYKRKSLLGTDITYLGVILYNQLDTKLKQINSLSKFRSEVKKYLSDKLDLLLAPDQLQTHLIS